MAWRNAKALLVLRAELDKAFPGRDRASDGGIGDAAHASRSSDHNPWVKDSRGIGVVRAFDLDAGPGLYPSEARDTPGDTLLAAVLRAAKAGHPALRAGAYVIYEGHIYSHTYGWVRRAYTGANRHESHVHVSVSRAQSGYDSTRAWGVNPPPPARTYTVRAGDTLWDIAARYGTDVPTLVRLNGLRDADALNVGQVLRLPTAAARTHTVAAGDTLFDLARRYKTTVEELVRLNGLRNPDDLAVGQVLRIPA